MRPYIDAHAHIGYTIDRDPPVGQTTGRYLARMAGSGVAAAIIGPTAIGAPIARGVLDTLDQNDTISRAVQGNPERFPLGLALVELRHERAGVDEIERALNEGGLRGIMYHPGSTSLGEQLYPHLEVCATNGEGLCLLHAGPQITARYARRFPSLTFLVGASDLEDDLSELSLHNRLDRDEWALLTLLLFYP